MKKHEHGATANTHSVFEDFIGCEISGVMRAISGRHGGVTLVFSCGWGITLSDNGAYWTESPEDVEGARKDLRAELVKAGI
jgi:hypothetical protein